MTTLLLVRHVEHALQNDVLLGRAHDAEFTEEARRRLRELAQSLRSERPAAIHSSPRRRARETAQAIAAFHGFSVEFREELDELDYGDWSGRKFAELVQDAEWQHWNRQRSGQCPPNGESMRDLQERMIAYASSTARAYSGKTVIAVTHAEPIRALILHAAGIPLDDFARIGIAPGGVSRLDIAAHACRPQLLVEAMPA